MPRPRTPRSVLALTLSLLTLSSLVGPAAGADQPSDVPADRLTRLARGVNITRWFWNPEGIDRPADHVQTWVSDAELEQLRAAGFTHVRLPIEPTRLVSVAHPGEIDPGLLADLDAVIARLTAAGFAVSVDPHGWEDAWQTALRDDPATQDAFIAAWSTLAAHLAQTTDPDLVFLEVLNEPSMPSDRWQPIADRAVAAIRAAAPDHTILVGGGLWNGIDGLADFTPPPDPNEVVVIHVYDPFLFTHQNAVWAGQVGFARGIPYPNDRSGGCEGLPVFGHDLDGWVEGFCTTETWNADAMKARIAIATDWAAAHGGVPLLANEFGVMPTAPYRDRLAWLTDVRTAFEDAGIGWAIWGWDDGFGLDAKAYGMDPSVLQALGMDVAGAMASPAP